MKKIIAILLALMILPTFCVMSGAADTVSREGWSITASSSHSNGLWGAEKMIDGSAGTYWHTNYGDGGKKDLPPYIITITLPEKKEISGFSYVPRQDNPTGIVTAYNVYVSENAEGQASLIASGRMDADMQTKDVSFGYNIGVRTFVFEITEGNYGYGTCAEFNLLAPSGASSKTVAEANMGKTIEIGADVDDGSSSMGEELSREGWTVESSSVHPVELWKPDNMLDGNTNTYWHSSYTDSEKTPPPYKITFTLPETTSISGFSYVPRQDNPTGIVTSYNIYASESDNGEEKQIYSGEFDGSMSRKYTDFGFNIKAKKVIFEITNGNYGYGSCAEFYLYAAKEENPEKSYEPEPPQADGMAIRDKSGWTIKASSEKSYYPAEKAIDGKKNSIWHSDYTDDGVATILSMEKCPHTLEVTFGEKTAISGFSYVPREEISGRVFDYEFYIASEDDSEWVMVDKGRFEDDSATKTVDFLSNTAAKKVMFKIITSQGDYGAVAELDVLSENPEYKRFDDYNEFLNYYKTNKLSKIDSSEIYSVASNEWRAGYAGNLATDGDLKTAWHTNPDDKGKYPFTLSVDLSRVHSVCEIVYYPRVDGGSFNGVWSEYTIWAGTDEDNLEPILEKVSIPKESGPYKIKFDNAVNARYFEFEITNGVGGYATCVDLAFYEPASESEKPSVKYTLQIGSNKIKIEDSEGVREIETDVAPFIDSGYTQIPIRGLLEQMGATIEWDGEYNKITVNGDGRTIKMQIYNNLVNVITKKYGDVRYTLTSVPQIKDSRTFVPLRFISEHLGCTVEWVDETKEIIITK